MGTDDNGRSVLTLLIWGARVSLFVGLTATVIAMVIGTAIGLASGYLHGWPAALLYRLTEWFLVIPFLPLALVLATLFGGSLFVVMVVIGITTWPGTALLIRAQTLSIKGRPYMERAKVLGAGHGQQMGRHILPNVASLLIIDATLGVVAAINSETALSYFGFGIRPPDVSLGSLLATGTPVVVVVVRFTCTSSWLFLLKSVANRPSRPSRPQ